jgi:hypothetical protein
MYEPLTILVNQMDLEQRLRGATVVATPSAQARETGRLRRARQRAGDVLIAAGMRLGGRYVPVNGLEPSAYRSHG